MKTYKPRCRTETNELPKTIIYWSKKKFSNNQIKLKRATDRLREVSKKQSNVVMQREERILKNQIKELWKREDINWKQRSQIKWLKSGD